MNLLKSLNKEQWTAVGAAALSLLLLAGGLSRGVAASGDIPAGGAPYDYERPPARFVDLPDEKFERYWQGRPLFDIQTASKLPIPYLRAPEPREEDPAAPPFRPGPATEFYNRGAFKAKYLQLTPGAPTVPDGQLPASVDVQALAKMEEPEARTRLDRRLDRERVHTLVETKTGLKYEGTLLSDGDPLVLKDKNGTTRYNLKRSEILKILQSLTYAEAIRLESQAIPPGPKAAELRLALAQKALGLGMVPEALEEAKRALEIRKDYAEAVVFLVQAALEGADFEGALAAVEQGLAAGAGSADLHYEAGRVLRAMGLPEGAAPAFERALEASPRHARAKSALARALLDSGRIKDSEFVASDFAAKLMTVPETPASAKSEAMLVRALGRLRTGDAEKAKADLAEALKQEPGNAEAINAAGAILALEGAWAAAGAEFVKAIKADQYLTPAWTNLATLLLLGGKAADAESVALAAQQRDPASAEAVALLGLAQLLGGKKDAANTFQAALSIDPRSVPALLGVGQVLLAQGADDAALGRFTDALRSDPWQLPAYAGAASAFLRSARTLAAQADAAGDDEKGSDLARKAADRRVKAETLLRAIKDFDPNRGGAWTALGCGYAGMGRSDEAKQALRMAASLLQENQKPVDPLVYYALGYVEYYFGQGDEAARVEAGLHEFQQGEKLKDAAKDPFSVRIAGECAAAVEAIEDWKVTALRFDERFERESGKTVGPHWVEVEDRYGIEITLDQAAGRGGRAKFSGKQAIADWGVTTLGRDIPGEGFHALEATLYPESKGRVEYGLALYTSVQGDTRIGFHVGVDAQGKLRYNPSASDPRDMDRKDMALGWTEIRAAIPDPKELRIRLTKGLKGRATTLTVSLWDPQKGEWLPVQKDIPIQLAANRGNWRVAVFVRAPLNQDVLLGADNIRVYERGAR